MTRSNRTSHHVPARSWATGNPDMTVVLEDGLCVAEAEARKVLTEHAEIVEAAATTLPREVQKVRRQLMTVGFLGGGLEHNEPKRRNSKLAARPCDKCEAARKLLTYARQVRSCLQNNDAEAAAFHALGVGAFGVAIGLGVLEEDAAEAVAHFERQAEFARHKRGPRVEEKRHRDQQILDWNAERLTYPTSGKPRERYERVRIIHELCQEVYHKQRAEARSERNKEKEAAAEVWNIGRARIDQIIPRKTKRTS